ncbi:MAG TPA: hypothetical protein DCP61_04395 [Treponema sp.]|nr:hypothetical protein [Treponema sp.]
MEGRLSNMQNCAAILQYLGKSKDGFFLYLPTNKKPMEGRLSNMQNCYAILQYLEKSTEGFFQVVRRHGAPAVPAEGRYER